MEPFSLGRFLTGAGRADLGSNLAEQARPSLCDRRAQPPVGRDFAHGSVCLGSLLSEGADETPTVVGRTDSAHPGVYRRRIGLFVPIERSSLSERISG